MTAIAIADVKWRQRTRVSGRVRSVRVHPWGGVVSTELVLVDDTGGLFVVFLGRRRIAGVRPGTRMTVEGMVGEHDGRPAILNPDYELAPDDA